MGCGSSSLKGEKQEDITEAPKPVKKVATNFSTVDYENPGTGRRNTEYAPHDTEKHKPSEALSPLTEKPSNPIDKDAITQPGASTQPQTTPNVPAGTFEDRLSAGQSTQDPLSVDVAAPKHPYVDTTASPTSPTAPNVSAAFPESHETKQAQ